MVESICSSDGAVSFSFGSNIGLHFPSSWMSSTTDGLLPNHTEIEDAFFGGFWLATSTVIFTIVLEFFSFRTVRNLCRQQRHGVQLYQKALWVNFFNHYILGVPVYMIAETLFCQSTAEPRWKNSSVGLAIQTLLLTFLHNAMYYYVHEQMHSSPTKYQYHKFHHQFRLHVPPMAANAVSIVEYLVAYVLPFGVAALVLRPDVRALQTSIGILSFLNLVVHTPRLRDTYYGATMVPSWMVSTEDHLTHHEKLNCHYASPVFNIDWMVKQLFPRRKLANDKKQGEGS